MDCSRSRCTADGNPPIHTIQPLISERNSVLGCDGLQASASPVSHLPADFEEVGKIPIHGEGEPDRNGKEAVVVHAQALEAAALPQEPSPRQMQRSARDLSLSLIGHVGIREIDVEQNVVFLDCRAEQQRPLPIDGQRETGQKTGPFVVEALRARSKRMDVAVSIEQAERVALLQHLDVVIGQRGGGHNGALIIPTIDLFHESLSSVSD